MQKCMVRIIYFCLHVVSPSLLLLPFLLKPLFPPPFLLVLFSQFRIIAHHAKQVWAGTQRQMLIQRPWRRVLYWLAPHCLFTVFCSKQDHQPRSKPHPRWDGFLKAPHISHQEMLYMLFKARLHGGIFLSWAHSDDSSLFLVDIKQGSKYVMKSKISLLFRKL